MIVSRYELPPSCRNAVNAHRGISRPLANNLEDLALYKVTIDVPGTRLAIDKLEAIAESAASPLEAIFHQQRSMLSVFSRTKHIDRCWSYLRASITDGLEQSRIAALYVSDFCEF